MYKKNTVILDLTNCKYLGELQQRIKKSFNFPDFYGENWSAFWDLLWSNCTAEIVDIIGTNTLPKEFDIHLEKMYEILKRNKIYQNSKGRKYDFKIIN